jgi:uncharacterized protein (TIGR02646 family)
MIFVERPSDRVPEVLSSARAKEARAAAEAYFSAPQKNRLQERFSFDSSVWMETRSVLADLFARKCAFCETPIIEVMNMNVEHFRPKLSAGGQRWSPRKQSRISGEALSDGYWWLAYAWENLYLMCSPCIRNKGNTFPIKGPRAKPSQFGPSLASEQPLLLDPCMDHPERFLHFQSDGTVIPRKVSRRSLEEVTRAKATIEILGLNRSALIEQRKEAATEVLRVLESSQIPGPELEKTFSEVLELTRSLRPFLAVRRDVVRDWTLRTYTELRGPGKHDLIKTFRTFPELGGIQTPREAFASLSAGASAAERKGTGERPPQAAEPVIGRGGYIEWVEIRNFKAISELRINFPHGTAERMGWKVLLGENGAGKSSILQAIALALVGPHVSKRLLRPDKMLHRLPGRDKRADEGVIRVQLSKAPHPIELKFNAKGYSYPEGSHHPTDLLFRAYGATRLLPRQRRRPSSKDPAISRAANLFNPFTPVCDANAWLANLKTKEAFASAALSLKDLLRIPKDVWLHRDRGRVVVPLNGVKVMLDELSAGYESILVLAVDVMSAVHGTQYDMSLTAGIVLLDEIDAHLHPRWKMEIVPALRRCFPNIQFVVTTHEPLCLRGLEDNEIALMRREGRDIVVEDDLPSPVGLRVDQLLTSSLFGLHSTIDPELDSKFVEYYALLAKHDTELSESQRNRLGELKKELSGVGILGHTRRDQIVYEAIDEYLAKEPLLTSKEARIDLKLATKRRISALLAEVSDSSGLRR